MKDIELGFDPKSVYDELMGEEPDDEGIVRVFLGTVFNLYPSGKYYTPYANGNVTLCPACNGSGKDPKMPKAAARRARAAEGVQRREWVAKYGMAGVGGMDWPPEIREASARLTKRVSRYVRGCPKCNGVGSEEADADERWTEMAEAALDKYGVSLVSGEGDPCDIFAEMHLPDDEEEEEVDPQKAAQDVEAQRRAREKINEALREAEEERKKGEPQ